LIAPHPLSVYPSSSDAATGTAFTIEEEEGAGFKGDKRSVQREKVGLEEVNKSLSMFLFSRTVRIISD
jgi:hypothetical protein